MASERELNLLIRARDEATKTIENNQRAFKDLERSIGDVQKASSTLDSIPDQMVLSQKEIQKTTTEFKNIEKAISENEQSVKTLNKSMKEFGTSSKNSMDGAGMSISKYNKMLRKMGLDSSTIAELSAAHMEKYKDRFIDSINKMQNKATQGEQIQESFEKMGRPLQGLTRKLNGVSSDLERMARAGHPAVVALAELGPNPSMDALQKKIQFINKGIGRMTAVATVAGLAFIGFTYGMGLLAKGPNPADVLAEQEKAIQHYADTLATRTEEIYNTWGLFEKAQITHTTGAELMKNLQGQVKILQDWSKNLGSLAKKGVDEGMIAELRKMGPAAAGEIAALNSMSGPELDKYVELWRQKHNLAKVAAVTELEGLKEETKKKIQELQDSLKPLGISMQEFKNVWLDALGPFIEVWGIIAAKVVDFGTYIGELVKKVNEINPEISAAAGMFMYLFTALTLLMSPLALGISRAGGLAVAFKTLWGIIGGFVTGFLAVAAYAAVLAAAFVALGYAAYKLWTSSEILRDALINGFQKIKTAVLEALAPLSEKFEQLKTAFMDMVAKFTGGTGTMGDIWKVMGDKIGAAINWVVDALLPILVAGIEIVVQVVSAIIDGLIFVFGKITEWWSSNSGTIGGYLETAKGYFMTAFNAIRDFILSVMPQVSGVVKSAIDLIKTVFSVAMPIISSIVKVAFGIIKTVMSVLWGPLVSLIQSTWNNIKNVITSGLNIIQNVIQLFTNILKGNWSAAWENVKAILYNGVVFLWNLVQLWFVGKLVGSIKAFATSGLAVIKTMWTSISTAFTSTLTAIKTGVTSSWTTILTTIKNAMTAIKTNITTFFANAWVNVQNTLMLMRTGLTTVFNVIKTVVQNAVNFYKNIITTGFNLMKTGAINAVNAMKNGISTALNAVKTLFQTMKDKIISTVKSIDLMQIGKDIIQGLINGIGSMASSAWDAVKNIGDGIKDAIKGALKIKSPSRIAIEIGGFFSEGLAIGIERMAKKAFEQAHNLADGVMAPVNGGQLTSAAAGYTGGASGTSKAGAGAVYVTFEAGAFDGAFPGVTKGEEVAKAAIQMSLKSAFKLQ